MPKAAIGNFGHFHNSYLELGVAYGLGATAIFLFLLCFLFCRIISALKSQQLSPGLAYIGLSWLIFFSIANIFESYVMYRSGYTLFSIIGGALYGLSIPKRKQHAEPISQNS
jgi:O-antigen ligase